MTRSNRAMIVAPQNEAADAGAQMLLAGGNAVDAAIACALAQSVVDPLMCGIAGFGCMGIYLPQFNHHGYIDFHAPAPGRATPTMWEKLLISEARDGYGFLLEGAVNDVGYQSIGVPASLRAYEAAHRQFGQLPWAQLFEPAIAWADNGWTVRPHVHAFWSDEGSMGRVANRDRLAFTEGSRNLYCRPDGSPK